jgi:iron complex transport system substrate-binding protein
MRIVSLVPSITETIVALGLKDKIVGCTSFCVRPPDLHHSAKIIGGTKNPKIDLIKELKPTHIVTNSEENRPADIAACKAIASSHDTFPKTVYDVVPMLKGLGEFLGTNSSATAMCHQIEEAIQSLKEKPFGRDRRFVYLIWEDPYMSVNDETYISSMLKLAGFKNAVASKDRYPKMTVDEMKALKPDLIFMSSEPFPFRKRNLATLKEAWPKCPPVMWADGQELSWYGVSTVRGLSSMLRMNEGEAKIIRDFKSDAPV